MRSPCGIVKLLLIALPVASATIAAAAGPSTHLPGPASPNVLLWLPVHASEPDDYVHAAADCLFRRWTPSLSGHGFDIVVTLAGGAEIVDELRARVISLQAIIQGSTHHLSARPRVTPLPVTLTADAYDVDEARGGRSSFAGPNELFYAAMTGKGGDVDAPTSKNDGGSLSALIARYAYVQVIETDCCATASGWLDALLQPMLADPAILISGSRGRGACWTGAENGGCKPTVDPATPHTHLRDHINGNAMYRVGPDLTEFIASARNRYGSTVPFDVALHLVSGGKHTADNGRAYSVMGLPVDESRFADAAYFGLDSQLAFIHAPRRLRAPAQQDALRRLDTRQPVTVVVVRPGTDPALLAHVHAGLVRARETRNFIFLVADEAGYAVASRLAPMRVLMVMRMAGGRELSGHTQVTASILHSLASLARASLATFTITTQDVVLQPYTKHLVTLRTGKAGTVWFGETGGETLDDSRLHTGLIFMPPGQQAAAFLEAWADEGPAGLTIQRLAARHRLSLASLPPDLFPPASSFAGPLWTDAARHKVATVVAWDGGRSLPATPAALSAVGLWSRSSAPFTRCANYSMLGTRPLPFTSPAAIQHSLAARAAFGRFVQEKAIACAVLPGFRLATTDNVVPDEAVLGGRDASFGTAVAFTSVADLEAGSRRAEFVPFEHAARMIVRPSNRLVGRPAACAAFGSSSCFSPRVASLVDAAIAALPPSYQCALDTRRGHEEVALLSLEGRLGEVGEVVRRSRGRLPILLTGAWRHVAGGQLVAGNGNSASPPIITLADLAAPPAAPVDPMSRLVRFGAIRSTSSLASSPWADVIEYAVCQGSQGVHDLGDAITPVTPASALARRAALIPPAVLAEDLAALARWLARPDRPSLAFAQRAHLAMAGSPPGGADDFGDAVLAPLLGLAGAVGAKLTVLPALPVPWTTLVGEPALRRAHSDHAALLPGSLGVLLGPPADVSKRNASHGPRLHPASAEMLRSPDRRCAVRALERALGAGRGGPQPPVTRSTLHMPAILSPAQHARLKHFGAGAQDLVFSF